LTCQPHGNGGNSVVGALARIRCIVDDAALMIIPGFSFNWPTFHPLGLLATRKRKSRNWSLTHALNRDDHPCSFSHHP